jgi:integrase/recombinase XerD
MDHLFFITTTIAILFIIIGLRLLSTKLPFGLLCLRDSKTDDSDQVIIRNGRVIHPAEQDHPSQPSSCAQKSSSHNDSSDVQDVSGRADAAGIGQQADTNKTSDVQKGSADIQCCNTSPTSNKQLKSQPLPHSTEEGVSNPEPSEDDPQEIKKGRLPKIERFWDHLDVAGRGKRTIQEYQYEWKWWQQQALKKKRTVYTLRLREIEEILKGITSSTTRRKIAFLRTLSKWYLREGRSKLYEETGKITVPKLPKKLPKDKGTEDFEKLREKAKKLISDKDRTGIWIALKLICGLRISEVQTARAAGKGFIQVMGKGQKERLIPAPEWIIKGMKKIPADGRGGWRKDRKVIWYHLAKNDLRNPHSLRHTCASELLRRDMKIEEIKEFLGHENIATTNIYARSVVPARAAELLDN